MADAAPAKGVRCENCGVLVFAAPSADPARVECSACLTGRRPRQRKPGEPMPPGKYPWLGWAVGAVALVFAALYFLSLGLR